MINTQYEIKLDIFEGPMDLLVHLIRKNDVDIYDIPISMITDQYLEYIDIIKILDVDYAGDFLFMASTLTQIKSKMLLPFYESSEDEDDPRIEIIRPLLEYIQIKSAAEKLLERNILGKNSFKRNPEKNICRNYKNEMAVNIDLFELIKAFNTLLSNIYEAHKVNYKKETISIKEKILQITETLKMKSSVTFNDLFLKNECLKKMIVTFLAILEMCKLNLIEVEQQTQNGIIRIFYL